MKVYIQKGADGECTSVNGFVALEGFRLMGWEIVPFVGASELQGNAPDEVVVGHIGQVRYALRQLGRDVPAELGYPVAIRPWLGRRLWQSTINTIASSPELWPVFVKPIYAAKKFTGVLVRGTRDLVGCGDQQEDTPVWCSEPVSFVAEWRCFVRYGQVLDARHYRGDWRVHFDARVVEQAVAAYADAPAGYSLDVGLTDDGRTVVVEVNDGYSLGAYGLTPLSYAKLLSARWAQMTGSQDYCNF
ncbi:ATP-grasp domain-containing protein [Hymenobacter weizhouensis]|uniref:ATP-grasp domain-containing protein n=1 Tax=Hymenobacter sp. YIM 151500-1 TaxID=2987689 RepID=UPI00222723D0|nr:ATP-grasp domain-containing protein [Hymenobacter sp. YIM 151500-1]UYZ64121.1 ATP-grasp domain-containing protein [Hymenobacter sp. YIM 151500-1]